MKEKEVTISEPDKDELKEINPLLLMKSYQTDFKMRYIGTVQEGNLSCEKVELYPNDLKSNYSIVTLLVEKNTLQPKSISLKGKDGLTTTFVIKNLDHSKTIADEEFVFDAKKYNSFEVIDLR
jgi:outer membrane lipoprotein-sorting protein